MFAEKWPNSNQPFDSCLFHESVQFSTRESRWSLERPLLVLLERIERILEAKQGTELFRPLEVVQI